MEKELKPNESELAFLMLSYNRFFDIFEEASNDSFWEKDEWYIFSRLKEGFAVYSELLNYEPIKWIIENIETSRPPMEPEIGSELFKFIINIITHFPFFDRWDDVWVSKLILNRHKEKQSIDKFIRKYLGKKPMKYGFWEKDKNKVAYFTINFPKEYKNDTKIFLKDILNEKDGIKFSFLSMKQMSIDKWKK